MNERSVYKIVGAEEDVSGIPAFSEKPRDGRGHFTIFN
jgi:hypothetical protein